jgi:hypothetical protein
MSGAERSPLPGSVAADHDVDSLRRDRDSAIARARALEHELGELRGKVKRLELVMWRRTARRRLLAARVDRVRMLLRR